MHRRGNGSVETVAKILVIHVDLQQKQLLWWSA
jgi:hypothetical protein